MKEGVIL